MKKTDEELRNLVISWAKEKAETRKGRKEIHELAKQISRIAFNKVGR